MNVDQTEQAIVRHVRVDLWPSWFRTLNVIRALPEAKR